MDKNNLIDFPVKSYQRRKNVLGPRAVECIVSGRWLQFPEQGSAYIRAGEVLHINVMTNADGENDRKLCELMITRENLLKAIEAVKPAKA